MATVLDEYTTEEQRPVVFFCRQEDSSVQRMFIINVSCLRWKCLSRKAVRNWVEKSSEGRTLPRITNFSVNGQQSFVFISPDINSEAGCPH
jgi:ABC-type tungstate transport system permease subunit